MNAVHFSVGKTLLRQLSGFKGYPKGEGEKRFIEVLCESAVSVEHATAIVEAFDGDFPTVRMIRDTAFGLRPKFEVTPDQRREWEAKYGPPDTAFSRRMAQMAAGATDKPAPADPEARRMQYAEEKRCMLWQAIRDSIYYTEGPGSRDGPDAFWTPAMDRHNRNHPQEVAAFRAQLAESGWDALLAVDWLKSPPKAPARRAVAQKAVAVLERPREPGEDDE
jgi:hypothetical protein